MSYAGLDPLLIALVEKLPRADDVFTSGDRERWLAAMNAALQLLYPPEWTPDARRKAREARSEVGLTLTPQSIADAAMTLARAKEEAAAHFPTIAAPEHGKVTIGVPPDGFDGVLVVPAHYHSRLPPLTAEKVGAMRRSVEGTSVGLSELIEEAPSSTTSADAVDDESGGEEASASGAGPAPATSPARSTPADSPATAPSSTAPTKPSTTAPARAKSETARRHFTADQRGAIIKRAVREGVVAVADDTLIHRSTIDRWMREMPVAVATFTTEWEQEQAAAAEGEPTVAQLEAERDKPVPPKVQWPTTPIERRPVDPERVRRQQADQA